MATLKFTPSNRADLSQVPITEGQFILTNDTNEAFYDVAYDIRFKTSSFVALDTDADRFKLSNNDKASAGKVYYVKGTQLFYTWTQEKNWNNVIASQEISKVIGDYKNITPTTLVKGEERFAPLTIASQVYTDDGETVESKVRQISHISSSFDSIVVTKKGKTFNIPVPFEGYFNYPNAMLVYIGTVQIYPNRYSVENNTITFQEEVDINRTINFQFIYNTQAPKLETMNFIDGAYIAKGTIPIDRMVKYSNDYMTNDTTAVATSAAVKGLYDVMANLMDRSAIVIRCTTKDDNSHMGTNLSDYYKLIDGNILLTRFHADVADNATITVGGVSYPIFVGASPVKAGQIKANDELSLQFDAKTNRLYVTNGMPYLIDSTTYTYTATSDGESNIKFDALNYNPGTDKLEVFQDGIRLTEGINYKFSETSKSIVLLGYSADKGDTFELVVYKVSRSRGSNNQVTIYRPELDESVNRFRDELAAFKKDIQKADEKSLSVIFPKYGAETDIGDCTIVGIDNANWFMVDCFGESNQSFQSITRCMDENQITKFKFILITHFHADHYGNLEKLITGKKVEKVYLPDVSKTAFTSGPNGVSQSVLQSLYNKYNNLCLSNNIPCEVAPNGLQAFNGAELTFYNNSQADYDYYKTGNKANNNYNNLSIGLLVSYIGRNVVLEGDCLTEGMQNTAKYVPSNVDLLKSHHHGITEMPAVYRKISPTDVVVTANAKQLRGNTVGHNYQVTLSELGANIYGLGDQVEDIKITYTSKNNSVNYNSRILRDGVNMQGSALDIYLDQSYTGNYRTGDKETPFNNLSDVIRFVHSNNYSDINVNIKSGDYTGDDHLNDFADSGTRTGVVIKNIQSHVEFKRDGSGNVFLPPLIIKDSKYVGFENIQFKVYPTVASDTDYANIVMSNTNGRFERCTFNNSVVLRDRFTHILVTDGSNAVCNNITLNGSARSGLATSPNSNITVGGDTNTANNVYYVMNTSGGGTILVNTPFNWNTTVVPSNGNTIFRPYVTPPKLSGITKGQIAPGWAPYGGVQYYIADGQNGWLSVDHFNIGGNLSGTPNFAGQFGYNRATKTLKFALDNKSNNDWLELANVSTVSETMESIRQIAQTANSSVETMATTLIKAIEMQSGYRIWNTNAKFVKGEKFIYEGKAYQVVSNNAVFVNNNNATTLKNNSNVIGGIINLEGNSTVQYFDKDDNHLIGELVLLPYKPDGYVLANGAEVTIARYPRLYEFVEKNSLWTTDVNKKGLFRKSGTDKFFLPDYRYVYLKADIDSPDIGNYVTSSAPNITGEMAIRTQGQIGIEEASGAFVKDSDSTNTGANMETFNKQYFGKKLKFDASRSSEVYSSNSRSIHPDHINLYPMMKF